MYGMTGCRHQVQQSLDDEQDEGSRDYFCHIVFSYTCLLTHVRNARRQTVCLTITEQKVMAVCVRRSFGGDCVEYDDDFDGGLRPETLCIRVSGRRRQRERETKILLSYST